MNDDTINSDSLIAVLNESYKCVESERVAFIEALECALVARPDLLNEELLETILGRSLTKYGQKASSTATSLRKLVANIAHSFPAYRPLIVNSILASLDNTEDYRRINTDGIHLIGAIVNSGLGNPGDVISGEIIDTMIRSAVLTKSATLREHCFVVLKQIALADVGLASRILITASEQANGQRVRQRRVDALSAIVLEARPELIAKVPGNRPTNLNAVIKQLRDLTPG